MKLAEMIAQAIVTTAFAVGVLLVWALIVYVVL
jgi:hypothetical protein